MTALVIVVSVVSIVAGCLIAVLQGAQAGFVSSVVALVLACGGWFFLVVAATGGLS